MEYDLNRFRDVFFDEAGEHIEAMESALLELESAPADAELLGAIFRAVHSIKGSGGMFGFDAVVRFAHSFETLLDEMRNGHRAVDVGVVGLLLRSSDELKRLIVAARAERSDQPDEGLIGELEKARSKAPASGAAIARDGGGSAAGPSGYRIVFEPAGDIFSTGMDPLLIIRDLAEAGRLRAVRLDAGRLPELAAMDAGACYLGWELELESELRETDLKDMFAFVEDGARIEITPLAGLGGGEAVREPAAVPAEPAKASRGAAVVEATTVRVASSKVDKLVDLVGELVIAHSVAGQILGSFSESRLGELQEAFESLERSTRELQERVMAVRMQPVGGIFSRFPRMVRDMAASLGKKVALEIAGEETELDKGVIEHLADPLTHLVRNSIDHGMEMAGERLRAGKTEQGTVRLEAYHESGSVVVEVSDDGGGLNLERIRAKAVANGLVGPGDTLSEDEVRALIFRPGFSTAEKVSDISGRGVGLDVVRRNVEALNGSIAVTSRAGEGSRFKIKLPLTLAILDGLLLGVGGERYVVPLVSIRESIRPRAGDVRTLGGSLEVVMVRGQALRLVRLAELFGVEGAVSEPALGALVLIDHDGQSAALLVDELLGQQQVVVKSLETNFRKVEHVMGVTVLGDGRAALILDVMSLAGAQARAGSAVCETIS